MNIIYNSKNKITRVPAEKRALFSIEIFVIIEQLNNNYY